MPNKTPQFDPDTLRLSAGVGFEVSLIAPFFEVTRHFCVRRLMGTAVMADVVGVPAHSESEPLLHGLLPSSSSTSTPSSLQASSAASSFHGT